MEGHKQTEQEEHKRKPTNNFNIKKISSVLHISGAPRIHDDLVISVTLMCDW
jgi:hypothetical protein